MELGSTGFAFMVAGGLAAIGLICWLCLVGMTQLIIHLVERRKND